MTPQVDDAGGDDLIATFRRIVGSRGAPCGRRCVDCAICEAVWMQEDALAGGQENSGSVVRVGDTVRRPRRPGYQVVEALLVHLEDVGFGGAPRFLGIDEQGRQILEYLEGVACDPVPWQSDDEANAVQLGRVAALLRQLHQATSTFAPPAGRASRRALLVVGPVWTHGDVGYSNNAFRGDVLVGLIDWEFAAPGHRCNDLAALVAMSVRGPKLGAPDNARRERATWLAVDSIAERYGLSDVERNALLAMAAAVIDDAVLFWQQSGSQASLEAWTWRANWFRENAPRLAGA